MNKSKLEKIARKEAKELEATSFLLMDHSQIRKNYNEFRERLPRIQVYYAVKANSEPEIIKTLYDLGSGFDVASLPEFNLVAKFAEHLPPKKLQNFIWNNIIYANPVKKPDSLHFLNLYKPLLTYDCIEEMKKIKEHCPNAGVLLRIKVSNEGSEVELSNKFGIEPELAPDLIEETIRNEINVEGISFHTGSQCNNPSNFIKALESVDYILKKVESKGLTIGESVTREYPVKLVDIGGGFPVKYKGNEQSFKGLSKILNQEFERLFPKDKVDILAEPGRFIVANAGTAVTSVILAKHSRTPTCYHLDDGIYCTFSGMIFDHMPVKLKSFKEGELSECYVFGPTCDGLDELSKNKHIPSTSKIFLPKLNEGDLIYAENMGAYTNASATKFNGYFSRVVHVNMK